MNNCTFIGRLVRDIEITQGGGTDIAKFSIAVDRKFKKGESDFINIIAFGKTAENLQKFFSKGDLIALQTRVQTGNYTNKEGKKVYTIDFVVDGFEFIPNSKKKEENNSEGSLDFTPVDDGDMPF